MITIPFVFWGVCSNNRHSCITITGNYFLYYFFHSYISLQRRQKNRRGYDQKHHVISLIIHERFFSSISISKGDVRIMTRSSLFSKRICDVKAWSTEYKRQKQKVKAKDIVGVQFQIINFPFTLQNYEYPLKGKNYFDFLVIRFILVNRIFCLDILEYVVIILLCSNWTFVMLLIWGTVFFFFFLFLSPHVQ